MPRMTLGGGYDVPGPVGADSFNEEQDAIKRRRLMLESLLSTDQTKNMTGLAGGLANFGLAYARGDLGDRLNEQEKDLSQRRATAANEWLSRMPQDTPAQAEINPSVPPPELESMGGGPPLPTNYKPPVEPTGGIVPRPMTYEHKAATPFLPANLRDVAKWSMEGAGFSPLHSAIALDSYKQALAQKTGGGDKWEIAEIFDDKTGQQRKVWVNKNNPSIAPVPIGGTQFKEQKDSALTERAKTADEMLRSRFPGKSDEWYKTNAQGLALGDIVITQDANGGVNVSSKAGAISGMVAPGAPAGGAPPAAGTQTAPAPAGAARNDLAVLQREREAELARPDSPLKAKNLQALDEAIGKAGGASGVAAPETPDAKYRQDERNRPYLPPEGIPGATMSTSKAHIDKLNKDVKSLADDYTKQKLPELITAANQAETKIMELAGNGTSGIKLDKDGKISGNVPGFGGPLGVANALPALTEDGRAMRLAMAPLKNIMLSARSGAAVSDQELNRLLAEMGQSLNQGDPQFWTAYNNFKERLSAIESGVTGGYAPIVRDAYFSRPDVQRPVWGGGGGAKTSPSNLRSKYGL